MMITRHVAGLVAASLLGVAAELHAQLIHPLSFKGYVLGCFYVTPTPGTCTPVGSFPFSDTFVGLTYEAARFGVNSSTAGVAATVFGHITLTSAAHDYTADDLHLLIRIFFETPTVGSSLVFTAAITGVVTGSSTDVVSIDFGPPKAVGWTDGAELNDAELTVPGVVKGPFGPGGMIIKVNDIVLHGDGTSDTIDPPVFGQIEVVSLTPEPASLVLLGTGLAGLIPLLRRNRRLGTT